MPLERIGYFGDGPWSHLAFDRLFTEPGRYRPAFVVARWQAPDQALKERAERAGVPFLTPRSVNAPDALELFRSHAAGLFVSMSFDQILKREIREAAPLGFINCHAGALPFYRGRNVLNWAIINGENRFGVTAHYVDDGIDTGDIVLQNFGAIELEDDYGTVLQKAYSLCAETVAKAVDLIAAGEAPRTPQDSIHPVGSYMPRRRPGDEEIDWGWPSKRVFDFVRGLAPPGPAARTTIGGRAIAIVESVMIPEAPEYIAHEGAVVGRDDEGVVIKTGDTTLRVTKIAEISEDGSVGSSMTPTFRLSERLGR